MSRSFLRLAALLSFLLATLTSAVLLPAYQLVGKDFVLSATLLYDLVDLLWQWLELFLLALLVALITLGVHQAGARGAKPLYAICGATLLFKYIAAIIASSIIEGSFDLTVNYGTTAFSFLLELTVCALTALIVHKATATHKATRRAAENAARRLKTELPPDTPLLPMAKPFARKNPLQNALYLGIGMVTFFYFSSFVASEIAFTMMGYPFSWADLPITLLYLLLTVLLPAFLAYLGAYFLVNTLFKRYMKAEK